MLRGRHRGLPVALDRAIVFPTEFSRKASEMETKQRSEAAVPAAGMAAPTVAIIRADEHGEKLPLAN